jgi:hypothetical protein
LPVSLHIESNKTQINVNETVNFTGSVYGINPNYTVPLIIFVNGTREKTLTAERDFNFSLFFSHPGTYEVYAFFPGDSLFEPAESNVVKIVVKEVFVTKEIITKRVFDNQRFNIFFYLLLILVSIVSFIAGLYARTLKEKLHVLGKKLHIPAVFSCTRLHSRTSKGKMNALISKLYVFRDKILTPLASLFAVIYARTLKGKLHVFSKTKIHALLGKKGTEQKNNSIENSGIEVAVEEVEEEKEQYEEVSEVNILEGVDLEEAYKLLFDTIVSRYGLKRSVTPRELLEITKVKKEPFAEMLEAVTELYEKTVYGNVELTVEEKESCFKRIKEILNTFKK